MYRTPSSFTRRIRYLLGSWLLLLATDADCLLLFSSLIAATANDDDDDDDDFGTELRLLFFRR